MRHMSFSLTTEAVRNKAKTVTRRLGWANLKAGERVCAIVKGMGLKKGEKIERICEIEIISNQTHHLSDLLCLDDCAYSDETARQEVDKEGFPNMTPSAFVHMFCQANNCASDQIVNRIEFKYV